jgi:hypothetical protein
VEKHQTPKTKHQISSKLQAPDGGTSALMFGAWKFSGVWCVEFGVSRRARLPAPAAAAV